jgi:hypothetical protein
LRTQTFPPQLVLFIRDDPFDHFVEANKVCHLKKCSLLYHQSQQFFKDAYGLYNGSTLPIGEQLHLSWTTKIKLPHTIPGVAPNSRTTTASAKGAGEDSLSASPI